MRGLSKLQKFLIICAVVFVCGIVCSIAGAASGGVQDMEKIADRYDWLNSPGARGVTAQKVEDYHSIDITGSVDVWIVGKDYYTTASWIADQDILEQTELDVIGPGQVCVVAGDRMSQPEISVDKGVLNINSETIDLTGINLELTEATFCPKILVCVPDEMLESLHVSGQAGDVNVLGVSWKKAKIELNAGDIDLEDVKSGSLTLETDAGDIELGGELMGTTSVITDAGDIEIDSSLAKAEYAFDVETCSGDVKVKEAGQDEKAYESGEKVSEEGRPHRISVKTDAGDVKLWFGSTNK